MPRTRIRQGNLLSGGSREYFAGGNLIATNSGTSGVRSDEKSVDTVHSGPPFVDQSDLYLRKRNAKPLLASGKYEEGISSYAYNSLTTLFPTALVAKEVINVDWGLLTTRALAQANSEVPDIDLPLFLFEWKDMPRLVKQLGDVLRRKRKPSLPEDYLAYNFGWGPLVSDLTSMVGLAASMRDRIRRHRNRQKGGTERFPLGESKQSGTYRSNLLLMPPGRAQTAHVRWDSEQLNWAVLRFNGGSSLPVIPNEDFIIEEMKKALGLKASAATLWEAFPWSFLIDYFSTIGDFMSANRGYVSFSGTALALMSRNKYTDKVEEVTPGLSGVNFSGGELTSDFKLREIRNNPTPMITYDPFLSPDQVATIGALLVAGPVSRKIAS